MGEAVIKPKKKKLGGARPGAGRKPGSNNPATIERAAMRKLIEQRVFGAHDALINAQIHIAIGQTFLYKIEKELIIGPKGGRSYKSLPPKIVTSQSEIEDYLAGLVTEGDMHDDQDPGATYYYLTTKEPNNEALKDLFNRVHGKPKETIDVNAEVKFSLVGLAKAREMIPAEAIDVVPKLPDQT